MTYRVSKYSEQNISRHFINSELDKAFKLWEEHADLVFTRSSDFDVSSYIS